MPWCPNCKTEYREGISTCADCGSALVDTLNIETEKNELCYMQNETTALKFKDYLNYAGIEADITFAPEENAYIILVSENDIKKAKVEYKAFLTVETEAFKSSETESDTALNVELSEDENGQVHEAIHINSMEDMEKLRTAGISEAEIEKQIKTAMNTAYKPAGVYETQAEKANDLSSTGITFTIVGAALLIFTLLNCFNVIGLFYGNIMTLGVLIVLSAAAIGVGINAFGRAKKASAKSVEEEKFTKEFNKWLDEHAYIMTQGSLDGSDGTCEEILYLKRTDAMKKAIENCFGPLDEDFVDSMLDNLYDRHFGA